MAKPSVSPPGCATSHWRDENQFCGSNQQKLVVMATSLKGSKKVVSSLIIDSHSSRSIIRKNLAKIGPADVEIGLTGILKINK